MRAAVGSPTAPDHPPGHRVVGGRYVVSEVLGRGGSATVYRAWDMRERRGVALKWFARGSDDPDDAGSLRHRREPEMLARLHDPGLVALLGAGVHHGHAYLVMTLADGPSLAARLAAGPLPGDEVAALGCRLASTLATVHAHDVTHRDVKAANVLLDRTRGPLLADFGIALLLDTTRVTATGAVVGTPAAMAPEQLRGEDVGPPADVYALGLLLIEALTGRPAFGGTGPEAVLARLHRCPAVPADAPHPLGPLLRRMTDAAPGARPTAREVAEAVGADAVTPASGAPRPAVRSRRSRRPGLAPVGAAAVALVAVALAVLLVGSVSPAPRVTLLPAPAGPAPTSPGPDPTAADAGGPRGPTSPPSPTAPARPAPSRAATAATAATAPDRGRGDDSSGREGGDGEGGRGEGGHGGGRGRED